MCENTIPNQRAQFASNDKGKICAPSPTDERGSYKSDALMSEEAILQGIMEISVISLPDEPHKYYSSSHACTKI
jgi:hypothetical protein